MKRIIIIALGFAALSGVREARATQFAAEVLSYKSGTGYATDWSTGAGFTNKDAIIGAPARETPGEGRVAQGRYQSPILVQWRRNAPCTRLVDITLTQFR